MLVPFSSTLCSMSYLQYSAAALTSPTLHLPCLAKQHLESIFGTMLQTDFPSTSSEVLSLFITLDFSLSRVQREDEAAKQKSSAKHSEPFRLNNFMKIL